MLPVARLGYHGLYIELKKSDHTNRPTKLQREWLEALEQQGYFTAVCYGYDEAVQTLTDYLESEVTL
jgi:hypothetical protein